VFTRILNSLRGQWIGVVALFVTLGGTSYAAISIPKHSITRRDLAHAAVGQRQLGKHSVGNPQLRTHAVSRRTLAAASVGSRQLRKGSVRGNQISSGAVSASKLAAGSVGSAQLAPGSVGSAQLVAGSVGSTELAVGSVTPAQLGGIASYTRDFATVDPSGHVDSSDPSASTTNWSDGTGLITFPGSTGEIPCVAFSSVPFGNGAASPVNSFAQMQASPSTTGVQVTADPSGLAVTTVVWVECAN
jgi:hypothetical protein